MIKILISIISSLYNIHERKFKLYKFIHILYLCYKLTSDSWRVLFSIIIHMKILSAEFFV